jgi:hypothetical protein
MAIIVVLGLLSIALALSYTMMRTQGSTLKVQENSRRRADARQAAMSGLMTGLRRMHKSDWSGADSTITGQLNDRESFTVTYTTGDDRLTPTHAEYADWPYRVTLDVTGYTAADDGGAPATHKIRAVARLVPRALSAAPAYWSHMQSFTVYQWTAADFLMEVPARVVGPVWMQGPLRLSETYPSTYASRRRYHSDLNAMRLAGRPDYRPLEGPVHWRDIQSVTAAELASVLGLATQTVGLKTATNWNHPGTANTYRIYPGGRQYTMTPLGDTLHDASLTADPKTNPLGIFHRVGTVEIRDNVTIRGQVIASEDVFITGKNVQLQSLDLPAEAANKPVRLPVLVVGDDLRVFSYSAATIHGTALVWDETEVKEGGEGATFELQGRVVTKEFAVGYRYEWVYDPVTWGNLYTGFRWQLDYDSTPYQYFPDYVALAGRKAPPKIKFLPDTTPHVGHFRQPDEAVYAPASGDPGLRWEMIDLKDEA